ncbi:unnamed protein product, partial [Penicillium discolor]
MMVLMSSTPALPRMRASRSWSSDIEPTRTSVTMSWAPPTADTSTVSDMSRRCSATTSTAPSVRIDTWASTCCPRNTGSTAATTRTVRSLSSVRRRAATTARDWPTRSARERMLARPSSCSARMSSASKSMCRPIPSISPQCTLVPAKPQR